MEYSEIKCSCRNCGATWYKGQEGDNEEICLRCEQEETIEDMSPEERDYYLIYGFENE